MTNDNVHAATNPLRSAVANESWFLAKTEAGYDFALVTADTTCSMNVSRWRLGLSIDIPVAFLVCSLGIGTEPSRS